jgi:Zn-dependent protease with chaperone function
MRSCQARGSGIEPHPITMQPESSKPAISGPSDRESFFEAQARNRRATWRLSVVCGLAAVILGIPLALTITPLLYAAALIVADFVSLWTPLPPIFWQFANQIARYGVLAVGSLGQGKVADPQALTLGAAVLLLPGAVFSVVLWAGVLAFFRRAGVGGALLALKAREPNPSNLKELQLSDVVQEMAIAAGLPVPRVMLIDAPGANAAAIGTSPSDARIVVSRGLLEQLSRDELEGALAHLVASIGNGDLRIAFRVTSVFETCGLLLAVINSPFGSRSRRTLWRIVRYGLAANRGGEATAAEAAALGQLLTRGTELETDDIDRLFDTTSSRKSIFRSVRNFLLFPIFLTNFAIKLSLWFFSFAILEPSMALLWRTRKYLADASAVQLTRNPDGLAQALRKLNSVPRQIPGGAWASHLFLVHPAGSDRMTDTSTQTAQQQLLARAWVVSGADDLRSTSSQTPAISLVMQEIMTTGRAAMAGDQQATARLLAFRRSAAAAFGASEAEMPRVEDLVAAQNGDLQAMRRLQQFSRKYAVDREGEGESRTSSDISSSGFVGFQPSLKRRLKRLKRMGARVELESAGRKTWIVVAVLSVILGPLSLLAVALLLLLIGVLTMASLTFIAIWMAAIHQLFVVFVHK